MGTVAGFGINDAPYSVKPRNQPMCPFYKVWYNMVSRVYGDAYRKVYDAYHECSIAPEWTSFMTFRAWMETQDWQGNHLDKDLLVQGNKLYSPDTCVFVSREVNNFLIDRSSNREMLKGVTRTRTGVYIAQCCGDYLGSFPTAEEAHTVYTQTKNQRGVELALKQKCQKIKSVLLGRYSIS